MSNWLLVTLADEFGGAIIMRRRIPVVSYRDGFGGGGGRFEPPDTGEG